MWHYNCSKVNNFILAFTKFATLLAFSSLLVSCGGANEKEVLPKPNIAPTAIVIAEQTVTENSKVLLQGSGTDADGEIQSYQWTQVDGIEVTIENAHQQNAYFIAPATAENITLTLQLTVTDNLNASHSDITKIYVTPFSTGFWEPSPISNCVDDKNISPIASSVPSTLTLNGHQMFEPSILFSDQTFTVYSRMEKGEVAKVIDKLIGSPVLAVDGEDPTLAYDDGTHGDIIANDGIYTRTCLYVPQALSNSTPFFEIPDLWVINKTLRGSESVHQLTPDISVNDTGFFISLDEQYNQRYLNNWFLHSPETCEACAIAWQWAGDVFDFFSVTTRDPVGGAGYVRVHDNIKGTGFTPPCKNNSYCYELIDGLEHQKLSGIIWSGWPGLEGLNHELGHGLLGVAAKDFPAQNTAAWNSGDGMHHDADITVNGELSGPFWDPIRGWPHSVVLENEQNERFETYLVIDENNQFRIKPLDDTFKVWDDILLYMMGLLTPAEVTKTYYKLVNPSLSGCVSETNHLVCRNDLVMAEQIIPFTVSDFIAKFGAWSAPEFYQASQLTLGILNISNRPHTNAEIVWLTRLHREFAGTSHDTQYWFKGTSWHKATRGLSQVNINAQTLVEQHNSP
ncbi:choice-of-anchor X domain-containing protein [Pseudoalteromonas sp.]|uniref:PKD domain-containing protein n=1 Tax=Pseudoalteromonas sp. TaxID=53249 RepID=UPI00356A19B2